MSPFPGQSPTAPGPALDLEAATREHYQNAVLYDYEYRRRRADVNFYRDLARELRADRVLELACGSGRVSLPLARDGRRVVGIDLSQPMLVRATERATKLGRVSRTRLLLLRGDMRRFALAERFPLIISAFNAFEHLYTRTDLAACLACVRDHLEEGGRLAFDVQNPNLRWLTRDPTKHWARTRFRDPSSGVRLEYTTNHDYDPVSQIVHIRFYYETVDEAPQDRRVSVVHLAQRKFFPAELEALMAANGFAVERRYGEFSREPLTDDEESQILICRAV